MNYLVDFTKRGKAYYCDENVSLERKSFYLVMICSIPILILLGIIFLCTKSSVVMSQFCFIIAGYVVFSAVIASMTKTQELFAILYCVLMNFFFTPIMFFMSKGVYYGMVCFFVLGIILTIFLLGNKFLTYVLTGAELFFDLFLIIFVYYKKDKVYLYETNMTQENSMALAFFAVSGMIIFLFIYQNYIQNEMSNKVARDNTSIGRAENTRGRFLANMTHEIRTPMNGIIGITELILKEDISKNTRENLTTIKDASGDLLQIINNILEYSKLDSGRAELIENEFSFRKMITEVIDNVSYEYSNDNIMFHVSIAKDIPDKIFGDEVRIKQVFRYIFFGSLSKNPYGSVFFDINSTYDDQERVVSFDFRIASSGEGYSDDEAASLFNAYSSYDSRQRANFNKTGLELSICKKILNMMNGDLTVDSIEGIGTAINITFSNYVIDETPIIDYEYDNTIKPLIYLGDRREEYSWKKLTEELSILGNYARSPLGFRHALEKMSYDAIYIPDTFYPELKEYIDAYECADKVFVITDLAHSIGDFDSCKIIRHPVHIFNFVETIDGKYDEAKYTGAIETNEITYPYARVLCVDDSHVNLVILENLLHEFDIHPTLCMSGEEALEILADNEFDLLFIDHKMPNMDGVELLREIKKLRNGNKTATAICATADFGANVKSQMQDNGFDNYLAKPISLVYLTKMLSEYLPEELVVRRKLKIKGDGKGASVNTSTETEVKVEEVKQDPLEFTPDVGIANLGGSKEAYISVLLAYYEEGRQKIVDVPIQYMEGNISLYTTNVHALKSSSATVGAVGISPLFKALEFAGKDNNTEFINQNSEKTFELFEKVLDKVEEYLKSEDAFEVEEENNDDAEAVSIDTALLEELSACILSMNLRRGEEIIEELTKHNYGSEINAKVKAIKQSFDNFEYMETKKIIGEIL